MEGFLIIFPSELKKIFMCYILQLKQESNEQTSKARCGEM